MKSEDGNCQNGKKYSSKDVLFDNKKLMWLDFEIVAEVVVFFYR